MMPILMLALLDLAGSAPPGSEGLRVDAILHERRVDAQLTNTGKRPLKILVGYTCGGPEPFTAVIDGGAPQSFQTAPVVCTGNAMVVETLAPGARRIVPSSTLILDGAAHRLAVRYQNQSAAWNQEQWHGSIESSTVQIGAASLSLELRATPGLGGTVELEAIHVFRGPTQLRFITAWAGVCAGPLDRLIVDGKVQAFFEMTACDGPVAAVVETLAPGGRFVSHGKVHLTPGWHQLRARYQVSASDLRIAGTKGNLGEWSGEVDSPEVRVRVP